MSRKVLVSYWEHICYRIIGALTILLATYLVFLKTSSDDLIGKYFETASQIGKLYALECRDVDSVRLLLKEKIERSSPSSIFDYLSINASYERQFNQMVLEAFEKKIEQRSSAQKSSQ